MVLEDQNRKLSHQMNKINKDEMELKTKAEMEEEKKREMLKY